MGTMTERSVLVSGHIVSVTDSGKSAPRTFLLIHGIGMGNEYFAELASALQPHGRVVAIDLPGFSDAPEPETPLSIPETGRLVIDFVAIEQLDNLVLVGHSMGSQVAIEAALARPDLFPELVLIAPTVNWRERSIPLQMWRLIQDLFIESPTVFAIGLHGYLASGPRWIIKKLRTMMAHEVERSLPKLRSHTLVIRGTADRVCPRGWVKEVTTMIPGARMIEIEGRGHETMVKDGQPAARHIAEHVGAV